MRLYVRILVVVSTGWIFKEYRHTGGDFFRIVREPGGPYIGPFRDGGAHNYLWAPASTGRLRPKDHLFQACIQKARGGLRMWKGRGCLSEILNESPKGDQSGRGPTFFWPLKAMILNFDYMNRVNKTNWQ